MSRRMLLSLAVALLLTGSLRSARAENTLTAEEVKELSSYMMRIHLTQHGVDQTLVKRMLKEFLKRLDPSRTLYLQKEADDKLNRTPEELDEIARKFADGNLAYFAEWIKEFKAKQLKRDEDFFATLKDHKDDVIKKITREEIDKIKPDSYAASEEDAHGRLLLLARSNFGFYSSYQPENDAFQLALQTLARSREKLNKIDPAADTPKEVMKAFMAALDPHSEYMDEEETEDFKTSMARSFSGIGVQIRASLLGAQVVDVIKDRPAFKSGRFANDDQIIAVDGNPLAGMTLDQVVKRIKGEKGTKVKITLQKAGKEGADSKLDVELVRDTIELADIRVQGKTFPTPEGKVGYIGVENFYEGVSGDVADRIKELSKNEPLTGLILDLRNNGGGYLDEAIKLAGLFITKGPVVAERGSNKKVVWRYDPDPETQYAGPLVVLVNQFSASASEIVSGSLKDYGRAVIVGPSQTHGKGTVQRIQDLGVVKMPGAIRITVQQYFIAGGDSVQLQGVQPDIKLPGRKLVEDFLEKAQDGAIPYARIEPELELEQPDFKRYYSWKTEHLEALKTASAKRVEGNKEFDLYKDLDAEKAADGNEEDPKGEKKPEGEKPKTADKKDLKDPQRDEAVLIVADMIKAWGKDGTLAKQDKPEQETLPVK
ncbi:MAG: PDZ domain-containing protein [Planctomycetota bacterium]|nr:PDZ domain-containing protein [Planctomycetota bacterium]